MGSPRLAPRIEGQFDTFQQWVSAPTAVLRPRAHPAVGHDVRAVCVDALGRRCTCGADFARARDEGTFPVYFFWDCEVVDG